MNRFKLAEAQWKNIPKHEAAGQLGILRREFEKRSRHLPIRQLMTKTGNAIQAIKPVFMMSPLSIATFIPPGSIEFDLVVFDEASQVKPVDAFGAIIRGKQVVVVGDSKQMPPSNMFDTISKDDENEEDDFVGDMESILGLFVGQNAPQRMLRWHYRSRHESLITVSNHKFYDNKLVVFPSPDSEKNDSGLIYHYLPETSYDRGGTKTNKLEAKAVALAVMEHAKSNPNLSLGVAAFSVVQMQAILDEIEQLRRSNPNHESFFTAHPHEPFFVKNLENVQGDERDVIFISIGYGKTAEGYFAMGFGLINHEGGERRLNVLISRAKIRCEVIKRICDAVDIKRIGTRIQAKYEASINNLVLKGNIIKEGDFLWISDRLETPIRDRSQLTIKKVELISPQELETTIVKVVRDSMGIQMDTIPQLVLNILGFSRVTDENKKYVADIIKTFVRNDMLSIKGNEVFVKS
jgi:superfamily I DNA and/or RNA helicase